MHQCGFASALGEAYRLEHVNGWVLKRQIREDGLFDLRSPYPNFAETSFAKINLDLDSLIAEKKRSHLQSEAMLFPKMMWWRPRIIGIGLKPLKLIISQI